MRRITPAAFLTALMTVLPVWAAPVDLWDFSTFADGIVVGENGQALLVPEAASELVPSSQGNVLAFDGSRGEIRSAESFSSVGNFLEVTSKFRVDTNAAELTGSHFYIGTGVRAIETRLYPTTGTQLNFTVFLYGKTADGTSTYRTIRVPFETGEWVTMTFVKALNDVRLTLRDSTGVETSQTLVLDIDLNPINGNRLEFGQFFSRVFKGEISSLAVRDQPDVFGLLNGSFDDDPSDDPSPPAWTISNHDLASTSLPLSSLSTRALKLDNPNQATVSQILLGKLERGQDMDLQYAFRAGAGAGNTIRASLLLDGVERATRQTDGAAFPAGTWLTENLTFAPQGSDVGSIVEVQFKLSGQAAIELDEVFFTTFTTAALAGVESAAGRVQLLPADTLENIRHKALLEWLLDRTNQAYDQGLTSDVNVLLAEIESRLDRGASSSYHPPKFGIGFYPSPRVYEGNPYLTKLYEKYRHLQIASESSWAIPTLADPVLQGISDSRGTSQEIRDLFWLYTHSRSDFAGDANILRALLNRLITYAEAYTLDAQEDSISLGLNDFFYGFPYTLSTAKNLLETFPDLLPPSQRNVLHQMFLDAAATYRDSLASFRAGADDSWLNHHLGMAGIFVNIGLYLDDAEFLETAKIIVDALYPRVYEDGATPYLGTQNESTGYHAATTDFLLDYHAFTGDNSVLATLRKTEMYSIISVEPGNVSEFATAPSWKTAWNTSFGFMGAPIVTLTGNPFLKTMENRVIAYGAPASLIDAAYYRGKIPAAPLPDAFVVYDRNIQGIRVRNQHYSSALSARVFEAPDWNEPGSMSYVSAMATDELDSGRYPLNSALMAVHPKIKIHSATDNEWRRWAYLTRDEKNSVVVGKWASSCAAEHGLESTSYGPTAFEQPWRGVQQWIMLPDRMVGMVEMFPEGNQTAYAVNGRIRLGYGRSGALRPKDLDVLDETRFRYGKFEVDIHDHNFDSITNKPAGVLRDDPLRATDIVLGTSFDGAARTWTPNEKRHFIVEIGHEGKPPLTSVERKSFLGMQTLSVVLDGKEYLLIHNLGDNPVSFSLALDTDTCHFPRGDAPGVPPISGAGQIVTVAAHSHVLVVNSPDPIDREPGWEHVPAMLNTLYPHSKTDTLADLNAVLIPYDISEVFGSPAGGIVALPPPTTNPDGRLSLEIPYNPVTQIDWQIEASTDLENWEAVQAPSMVTTDSSAKLIRLSMPPSEIPPDKRLFFRLRLTSQCPQAPQ